MYIKVVQVTFKSKDGVLKTQEYFTINDKILSVKFWVKGIKFPTNKTYKVRNYMDKDKALGAKKSIIFKGAVKKYSFGFNPSGYLQGKGFKT